MHTAERFFVIGRSLLLFTHTCPVTEFAAFKYGKFLLPPRFLTALSVPKMPAHKQPPLSSMPSFLIRPTLCPFLTNFITFPIFIIL